MGAHDSFQIQSLIIEFEMNHMLPLALLKIITKLLREVFPDVFSYPLLVYSHRPLHIQRLVPPQEVGHEIESCDGNCDKLQLGDR